VKALLRILELPYRGVNRVYRALYRTGVLRGKKLPRPVISVGNIGSGGAGKTPAVIAVCRFLESRGLRVAVLSRGYGRRDLSYTGIVTSFDTDKFGDEPVLIKRSIGGDVIIGSNRHQNAVEYLADNDCDVFVLDDGFQHLELHRDYDLVVDAPSGFHREGRSALRYANAVIPRRLRTLVPEELRGKRVFAFAGLARNEQFFNDLRVEGLELAGTRGFRDHHRYSAADLAAIRRDAAGATLVTTGKDAVKIEDPAIVTIGVEMVIEEKVLEDVLRVARGASTAGKEGQPAVRRKRRKNPIVQRIEYLAYRFVTGRVSSMSDASLLRWGTRLGALAGRILRGRDRLAMRNLRETFPGRDERELRRILDECWRHFGRELLQYLHLRNASLEELAAVCPIVNEHLLHEAIARGNGVLLLSGHWGGWEIGGLALMSLVRNVRTVARPLDNELLERDLQVLRAKTGAEVVDRRRAARALMRGLAQNAVVVLLPDQAVLPREGVLVPFLGRPAWTTPAPAKMAVHANATIVFAFCKADGLRHEIELVEPIRVDELTEDERDPVNLTKRINDVISARITARPELYLWMHDRWKGTRESGWTNGV
jgi:tetraacyldisaccharide-1-P 4'-kinase/lauroyl/myristoyl acyltransferase